MAGPPVSTQGRGAGPANDPPVRAAAAGPVPRRPVRPTGACGPWRGGGPEPGGRPWSPCGRGSRAAACAPARWAGRCVSPDILHRSAAPGRAAPPASGAGRSPPGRAVCSGASCGDLVSRNLPGLPAAPRSPGLLRDSCAGYTDAAPAGSSRSARPPPPGSATNPHARPPAGRAGRALPGAVRAISRPPVPSCPARFRCRIAAGRAMHRRLPEPPNRTAAAPVTVP